MKKNTEITTTNNVGYLALKDFNLSNVMAEEMSGLSHPLSESRSQAAAGRFLRFRAMIQMSRKR